VKAQVLEDAKVAAEVDETEHRASGMMIECKCCYSEVSFSQATHCGEGSHFFCLDCARRNAENEIGMCRWQVRAPHGIVRPVDAPLTAIVVLHGQLWLQGGILSIRNVSTPLMAILRQC